MQKFFALIYLFAFSGLAAQTTGDTADYYSGNYLRYNDFTYRKNIRTVQLYNSAHELTEPLITLNSGEQLKLSFDDLDADYKSYAFTLIHCSAGWQESNIMQSEYIDGFYETHISSFQYSRNSIQRYTHYSVKFPDESMKITKSGNYLLKVYIEGSPDSLVLTRRFMVLDEKVQVNATARAATIVSDRNYKQEIDFDINYSGYDIANPFTDITVVLMQNNRWDNAISNLQPQFSNGSSLQYNYEEGNVFNGTSEFRYVDIKSIRYQEQRINSITYVNKQNHVYIQNDEKRTFKRYSNATDLNGRYLVKYQEGFDSETEADYCWVHFTLPMDLPAEEGNVYLFGQFSDWQCKPEFRMTYDAKNLCYKDSVYLKQGYYNYEYVLLRDNTKAGDDSYIEGMHSETENEYAVLVYHRKRGTSYDQLIAVKKVNTRQ